MCSEQQLAILKVILHTPRNRACGDISVKSCYVAFFCALCDTLKVKIQRVSVQFYSKQMNVNRFAKHSIGGAKRLMLYNILK